MTLLKDWQYEHMLELGVTNFVRSVQHDNSSQQHIYIERKKNRETKCSVQSILGFSRYLL